MARGRASNGSGSITKKSDTCYELRWTVDGQRKSKSYKTFTEADKARREITAQVDAGTYIEPQKMKVSEWLQIWLDTYCGHTGSGTLVQYRGYVKNHINPVIGNIRLDKLQPHHVQDLINGLQNHGKKKDKPISFKTRKNVHGALSAALAKAQEIKYIRDNPATGCSIPKDDDAENMTEINPFTQEELDLFLVEAESSDWRDVYHLAIDTGMRLSECLGLRWTRVDFKKKKITVDAQLHMLRHKGDTRYLAKTKNRKVRSFIVPSQVIELLQKIKKNQAENQLKAGSAWSNPDGLVFTDLIGDTLIHSSIEHDFKRICKKIGCPDHRFHDLRHTFATLSLQHGADPKTLSQALGHYSVAFTLDVYGHVSDEMANSFAAIQERIIASR